MKQTIDQGPDNSSRIKRFGEVRELIPVVERIIDDELKDHVINIRLFKTFFDLSGSDEVTESELNSFLILFRHLTKRALIAVTNRDSGIKNDYFDYDAWIKLKQKDKKSMLEMILVSVRKFLEDYIAGARPGFIDILPHDFAHCVGNIINGTYESKNILYPIFTDTPKGVIPSKETLQDELYATLFSFRNINLIKDGLSKSSSYEDFFTGYLNKAFSLTQSSTLDTFNFKNISREDAILSLETLFSEIRNNPPEPIVKCLTYIWENKENPRVLVDLFFSEVGPFIARLKERKTREYIINSEKEEEDITSS